MIAGLPGIIPGGVSVEDFVHVTDLDVADAQAVLDEFTMNGIGEKCADRYLFEDGDKLKAAVLLLKEGFLADSVSDLLGWKDFEGLTGEILKSKGFAVIKNLILTKPRMEIDVIGIRLGIAMVIDCKHWQRYNQSSLDTAVKKQIERTRRYVGKTQGATGIPVIVTLYHDMVDFIDNVPIVPISKFASFVDEFYGNLDQMRSIGTG